MARTSVKAAPSMTPPSAAAAAESGIGERPMMSSETLAAVQAAQIVEGPALAPPSVEASATAGDQVIGAWFNSVHVTALWCNASPRNAWAAIEGQGWRKISTANDSSFEVMAALLSHVRQMNSVCNVRIESDNLIHEVYTW